MLAIRLQRIGKKHQPSYRVVIAERRSKLGGPPVEDLGFYNPLTKAFGVDKERVLYWLSKGAHATPTAHNLFVAHQVIQSPKVALRFGTVQGENRETPAIPEGSGAVPGTQ